MPKAKVAFIHTSPAAVGPVTAYYGSAAPEIEAYNLLDDGLLRLFAGNDRGAVEARLLEMIRSAAAAYGVEAALLTCSAVEASSLRVLRAKAGVPVVKIDEEMARQAVRRGRRLGVVVTFAPTREPTRALLQAAARDAGADVTLVEEILPGALEALLAGDVARHDEEVLAAAGRLAVAGVDAIVLAQVSMARVLAAVEAGVSVPVISSLRTSLDDLRGALGAGAAAG